MKKEDMETPIEKLPAGKRLRGMRELMGIDRKAFSEIVGMDYNRLTRIELGKQAMHDVDFEKVLSEFPHFCHWLTCSGPIDINALLEGQKKMFQVIALKLKLGEVPPGYGFEQFSEHQGDDQ